MADKMIGRFNGKALSDADIFAPDEGKPYVSAKFSILDGERAGAVYEWRGYLSDAARERTTQALIACGCSAAKLENGDLSGIDTNVVQVTLGENEYGIRVSFVDPAGGRGPKEEDRATGAKKKAIAALFRGTLRDLKGGATTTAPRPAANPFAGDGAANEGGEQQYAATGTDGGGDPIPF